MTPLEKAMMTHQPYVNPLDGVTEAFAQGVYEAPGQLAAVLDEFSPWAKLINAMSGKTLQQRTDAFTGANELGYSPEEYGASPLLQSMMRLGGNIVGDPLNAIPMGMVGKAGALKAADTISDDMLTTPMRNQIGAISDIPAPSWLVGKKSIPVGTDINKSEAKELLRDGNELRVLLVDGEPKYFWNANDALHADIGAYYGVPKNKAEHGLVLAEDLGIKPKRRGLLDDFR